MKKLLFLFACLSIQFFYGQATTNQSIGFVSNVINDPIPVLIPNNSEEIFRFKTGNVTQLDDGFTFDFNSSRWFSLGRVETDTQTVYGLRFQLPGKALTYGYQDISDANPRIQWIGQGANLGDLEFRVADSFTNTTSTLVAKMTSEGNMILGNPSDNVAVIFGSDSKLDIDNTGFVGLRISSDEDTSSGRKTGFIVDQSSGSNVTGGSIQAGAFGNYAISATGLWAEARATNFSRGISGIASFATSNSIGVSGFASSNGTGFAAGVFGRAPINNNSYAGYFDGTLATSGGIFNPSDKKLKENIIQEESALNRLSKLKPITYNYKKISEMNLSSGKQHGFISQEFAKVFPELTQDISKPIFNEKGEETSKYSYKAINYTGLISVLTAAVNELNNEVQLLKEEITNLKESNSSKKDSSQYEVENNSQIKLVQNIPNPFTDQTSISYQLDQIDNASLIILDLNGGIKKEYKLSNKSGKITIYASEIGKGMFFYSLIQNGKELVTKRMIIN